MNAMDEKKEMTAVEFLKGWRRLCEHFGGNEFNCSRENECPFHDKRDILHCWAWVARKAMPKEAVDIVQKWAEEHPEKTMRDDFFEKFPNAPRINGSTPFACAKDCYPVSCYKDGHTVLCEKCWERPLEV